MCWCPGGRGASLRQQLAMSLSSDGARSCIFIPPVQNLEEGLACATFLVSAPGAGICPGGNICAPVLSPGLHPFLPALSACPLPDSLGGPQLLPLLHREAEGREDWGRLSRYPWMLKPNLPVWTWAQSVQATGPNLERKLSCYFACLLFLY